MSTQVTKTVTLSLAEIQIPGSCQQTDPEVITNLLAQEMHSQRHAPETLAAYAGSNMCKTIDNRSHAACPWRGAGRG